MYLSQMMSAVFPTLVFFLSLLSCNYCCNEAVCRTIVSKCLLTRSCNCDLRNLTCYNKEDCFVCLGDLYRECCSCLGLCPTPTHTQILSEKSHVEGLIEPFPSLFKALTEVPHENDPWNSITFPIELDISQYGSKREIKIYMKSADQETVPKANNILVLNCTVSYQSKCMSLKKCKYRCQSMGASSYRWFHDACCECIGENCLNYGINESRCGECSEELADILDDFNEDNGECFDLEDYNFD